MREAREIASATVQLRYHDGTAIDIELRTDPEWLPLNVDLAMEPEDRLAIPAGGGGVTRETTGRRAAWIGLGGPVLKAERQWQPNGEQPAA